ncbi:PTS sugar transporter subunit IIB [Schleiferilactobacillus perolens]|jgi:PTS system cellobiose-specific IIB component|uniref:PTS EIIB type-3 domain-containing protein n=1 Tax=Schleiferilactobacillus perolens DSM 12744 TaxID=1423792 RepID=A0A0R1MSQ0_9LACO|nr:PTS fructose transporter subunit IIA [Schleiferilactobacillus perolens]KRL11357.1 hypothetical protein FD09_GL000726 [Schleiferilactobacillus perolens DSM 12744]MCI1891108.1 PTS fructose transporter subunit IIA [Schleiferilactobacillus harbinensis]MCI1911970.1 PTS fructose transporter subunit IIA [Schleiferilactobacillus harbinensis]MCI2170416.1 PTS fructose transporter subunit IIA [Schleiferilactobacillus perolens]
MRILLSCSGGMSSSLIAEALSDEAKKRSVDLAVDATGSESVADDLDEKQYDAVLLAPQTVYRKDAIKAEADSHHIPFLMIPRLMYSPLQAGKLLDLVNEKLGK